MYFFFLFFKFSYLLYLLIGGEIKILITLFINKMITKVVLTPNFVGGRTRARALWDFNFSFGIGQQILLVSTSYLNGNFFFFSFFFSNVLKYRFKGHRCPITSFQTFAIKRQKKKTNISIFMYSDQIYSVLKN